MSLFLNLFNLSCCQDSKEDCSICIDISNNSQRNPKYLENSIKEIKKCLNKNQMLLFVIYKNIEDLTPFNELKKDTKIAKILQDNYCEYYKNINDYLTICLAKELKITVNSLSVFIINLNNNNEFQIMDSMENENITKHSLKKMLKYYIYKNYKPPPEPKETDNNYVKILFRYSDEEKNVTRKFPGNTKVMELYKYIKSLDPNFQFRLFKISPEEELINFNNTLNDENMQNSCIIQVL